MIISHEKKVIFIANPKTATTSIEATLRSETIGFKEPDWPSLGYKNNAEYNGLFHAKHIPPAILKLKLGEEIWNSYFKFVFVRNPWDWLISTLFWNNQGLKINTFDQYYFNICINQMYKYRAIVEEKNCFQYTWADNSINKIGRFENLQSDFNDICNILELPNQELCFWNKTDHNPYRELYDDKTKELVREYFKKDIELFGYEF